jgi:signal transduction histidine kinase
MTPRWSIDWLLLLVLAALLVGLGYRVWRDCPGRDVNRWFALQAVVLASWVTGVAGSHSGVGLLVWGPWTFASAAMLPLTFLGFTRVYPERTDWIRPWHWAAMVCITAILVAACVFTPWIVHSFRMTPDGLRRLTGPMYPVYALFLPATTLLLLLVQSARWRRARGRIRLQLQYYNVGVLIVGAGGFTTNLVFPTITGRSTYSVFGPYFALAFLALVAHSIVRHRLLDLRVVVHRSLMFVTAVAASLLPAAALWLLLWPRLAPTEALSAGAAIVVVALLTPPLRDFAGRALDRYVYRERSNARRILRDASQVLGHRLDLEHVTTTLLDALTAVVAPEAVALYLTHPGRPGWVGERRLEAATRFTTPTAPPMLLLDHVRAHPDEALILEELGADDERVAILQDLGWGVVVPIALENAAMGLLAVAAKRSGDAYSDDDLDAVLTLTNHAASALKNAALYAELALAKDYLDNIVATMPSGVIVAAPDERILLVNPAASRLTAISIDNAMHLATLPEPLAAALRVAIRTTERRTYPELGVHATDPAGTAICITAPLRDHAGAVVGAIAVFSDLTPRRELELERARAKRLADFQTMTQSLAHEIANPLVPIMAMTRLLSERAGQPGFVPDFVRIVTRELNRMERLVRGLRSVGGPNSSRPAHVDLCKAAIAAVEVLAPFAAERGVRIGCTLGEEPLVVDADAAELEELFLNLLKNGIEAVAPEGGLGNGTVEVRAERVDAYAVVQIRDSGPGLPPTLVERLFDPFVTTKASGTGLGLAICAAILARTGGRLEAANAPDGGATFTVQIRLV